MILIEFVFLTWLMKKNAENVKRSKTDATQAWTGDILCVRQMWEPLNHVNHEIA